MILIFANKTFSSNNLNQRNQARIILLTWCGILFSAWLLPTQGSSNGVEYIRVCSLKSGVIYLKVEPFEKGSVSYETSATAFTEHCKCNVLTDFYLPTEQKKPLLTPFIDQSTRYSHQTVTPITYLTLRLPRAPPAGTVS
ncbi:hypothetical protein CBF23_004120 [Marinomonas agarivorans]|nr:hypothetical protein CBF23_004120 [Marinomonas agarivorans]